MMTMVISGSDGVTFPDSTTQNTTDRYGFVNRIINGDMRIDQRNAGASVSITTDAKNYVMDRFWAYDSTDGDFSLQQVTDAPTGFINSAKVTITNADASIGADQYAGFSQLVEGFNSADLAWGTASAQTVTLSFWVKSSLTGTFGGSLRNNAANRSYPFSYSIAAANTWEQKTITIAGDTSGTWLTNNEIGIRVNWSIADGPNRVGTAGAWAGANYAGASGQTQIISTASATWQITGVQLEVGSVATPFERRPYGTELALCQRYFYTIYPEIANSGIVSGQNFSATLSLMTYILPTEMRSSPSFSISAASDFRVISGGVVATPTAITVSGSSKYNGRMDATVTGVTSGYGCFLQTSTLAARLSWNAEL